ncbi:Por secretion system C-terminal sorting domain-containing protein [Chryseolinea serpens]|uniref:Por secretion system C-terminal sorting domain-containing protein n=1 Tax=Chryseolinea serpens TaxID=947013 RepID=A0A1M5NJE6_9BACT|nr:T9SS type A sorting domain-containing protein [Chryseolinea serpens]SHG89632.1 Por secretion system C-terminal sorting domain-containing protein [Chryseolinea serpens]
MKKSFFILILAVTANVALAQTYGSIADGNWTTTTNWSSGSVPPLTGGGGTVGVNTNLTISGNYAVPNGTINIAAGKTLTINGNFSKGVGGGGGNVNVYGTLHITGDVTLNAPFTVQPGGSVVVDGNVTVINSSYLTIGTNAAAPPYADMVIRKNLVSQSSGDITVEKNGRFALFGNFTDDTSGGTKLTIKSGGQVYIDKTIALVGGGDDVSNANGTTPIGLYINDPNPTVNTSQGATLTSNRGNKATMQTNDPPFYAWVAGIPNSPLPVKLVYFKAQTGASLQLTWATSSEKNFHYFQVERASEDLIFTTVGRVDAKGSSTLTTYAFTDEKPLNGKNYYRLKMIDLDEAFEYSPVVTANGKSSSTVNVYPNPITDKQFTIELSDVMDTPAQVTILDGSGTQILRAELASHTMAFQLPQDISAGLYYLRISSGHGQQIIKVAVR